jgi:hypothetical protein
MASVWFNVYIYGGKPEMLADHLLSLLPQKLIQPKSMELVLPGRSTRYKVPCSVDGEAFWMDVCSLPLFPGEEIWHGTNLTVLHSPEKWLNLTEKKQEILDHVNRLRDEAIRLQISGESPRAWVFWTFYGLTRAFYSDQPNRLVEGWFLRERISHHDLLTPIVQVICHFRGVNCEDFSLRFCARSHIWSWYSSGFDKCREQWVPKESLDAERQNARLLAETVAEFLVRFPEGEVEWDVERGDHPPDLAGFVPEELEGFLGPPNARCKIIEIPFLKERQG